MKDYNTKILNFTNAEKGREKPRDNSNSYRYRCGNCNNSLNETVLRDYTNARKDDKVTCPFCQSLRVREVKQWS